MPPLVHGGRAAALGVLALIAGVGVLWGLSTAGRASWASVTASGPDAPADLIVLGACTLGAFLTAWLGLGLLSCLLAALPGWVGRLAARAAKRLAPTAVRRAAAIMLGTTLAATATATPAAYASGASPGGPTGPTATATTTTDELSPGAPDPAFSITDGRRTPATTPPTTTRPAPTATAPAAAPTAARKATTPGTTGSLGPLGATPRPTEHGSATVTVVRGDSLWRIAARHLGTQATDEQISREWPRWYAANRAVVGPDPDLIRVGVVLAVPPPSSPGGPSS